MRYEILGIHAHPPRPVGDEYVVMPHQAADPDHPLGSVRVRLFDDNGESEDVDFPLPAIPRGVSYTSEIIGALLAPEIAKRLGQQTRPTRELG